MNQSITLGLDIGIGSIGWAIIDQANKILLDMGVRSFNEANKAQEVRANRSARRTIRRKKWREKQLLDAFCDFQIVSREELSIPNYLSYTIDNEYLFRPKDDTVYHLRKRALSEEVSIRELILVLYNICKTRGHFLLETIDFNKETVDLSLFKEKFHRLIDNYVVFISKERKNAFDEKILFQIFNEEHIKDKDLMKDIANNLYADSDENMVALQQICKLLLGNKGDLAKIDKSVILSEKTTKVNIQTLQKEDSLNDFLDGIVELYDLIRIGQILKEYNYICEIDVDKLDHVKEVYKLEKENPKKYDELKKEIQSKMNLKGSKSKRLRVVKNMNNKYPNGLYVKEARDILRKQQEYNPRITNAFIDICLDIIKARIPYYIGPLDEKAKNSWIEKTGKFKYSYEYSKKNAVNIDESIRRWKKRMISHCTYLPEEEALPKGSLLAEVFGVVNEINILTAIDQDNNTYQLTTDDKIKIFDELFLQKEAVKYTDVKELLGLKRFGSKGNSRIVNFKNQITLYNKISQIIPELKLHSIVEIFIKNNKAKINQIEEIILDINLFDEELSKKEHFEKEYDEGIAKQLSKLSSKGFFSFSKKFIFETLINTEGHSLLEQLFETNEESFTNEQMTLITAATDRQGNPIDFKSNKYIKKIKENNTLNIKLLMDEGKPVIPVSRSVIRSLNECFKVYTEIVNIYGVPNRVVIETARDFKDFTEQKGEIPAKHFNKMEDCYKDLEKQLKEQKKKRFMSDWDIVSGYLAKNKRKVELYIRQNGRDMISGDQIDINHLENYEIDHILPRGFGDNSMDNLMLIDKLYNSKKADRVPLMYIEEEHVTNKKGEIVLESQFQICVAELYKMNMISENKLKRLLLANTKEVEGFINRNLVDTRYIICELMSILRAYNQVNDYDTHIVALKSAFTSTYRNAFGMRKNREVGNQHHAHDAAIIAMADHILSTYYPNYDSRGKFTSYQNFLKEMSEADKRRSRGKLNRWIETMYRKAYNEEMNDINSLLSEVKQTVPLYSMKEEKNYKGAFYKATILSPKDAKNKAGVLGLLGVNTDKGYYTGVNCAAVDFYKYTDKKGRRKHAAIHIPKVIIDENGNINKDKYLLLIKKHYNIPELIDENGELKTYYFRLRMFRNELIYDTNNFMIQLFNIGSIANEKLELKHIYMFSYNDIYEDIPNFRTAINEHFNIRSWKNNSINAIDFKEVDKKELIDFCCKQLITINDYQRYAKAIYSELKDIGNYNQFLEKVSFINHIVNRSCTPRQFLEQYTPAVSRPIINDDIQYVKVKSSVLGIRYHLDEYGSLHISGPKKTPQKFNKITKEKFSWRICREVIQ